jgi:uncharacterized iron-regulated membrane protein
MKRIRRLHLYIGTFFAPAIIFFAFTGSLQVLGLHESKGAVQHPAWIADLASIHKDQRLPVAAPPRPPQPVHKPAAAPGKPRGRSALPMKIFVLLMALGLIATTLLGVYISFTVMKDKRIVWGVLLAGVLLPMLLLLL